MFHGHARPFTILYSMDWAGYVKFTNVRLEERLGVQNNIWRPVREMIATSYYILLHATRTHNLICLQFDHTGLLVAAPTEPRDTLPLSFCPAQLMQLITPFYRMDNREVRPALLSVTPDGRLGMANENIENLIDPRFSWNVTYIKTE